MFSINRLLTGQKPVRWVVGLSAGSQSVVLRVPGRKQSLLTRLSLPENTCLPTLSEFVLPVAGDEAKSLQPDALGVVLSNRYCRYLVVPWSDALLAADGGVAYFRRAFVDVYGEVARAWVIIGQDAGYGRSRLVCAIEASYLQGIRDTCRQRGLRLAFLRPYLDVALDRFRPQIKTDTGVFAVVEEGVVTIACWAGGVIVEVDVEACDGNWPEVLAAWCARNELAGPAAGEVHVLFPAALAPGLDHVVLPAWRLLDWPQDLAGCVAEHPALALPACAL